MLLKSEYSKRLYANKSEPIPLFPKIWRLGGTVEDLQGMIKGR